MNEQWNKIKKLKEHPIAKNKNLEAIYITEDNVEEIQRQTEAFSVFSNSTLLTGVMSFQKYPVWVICINPKSSKNNQYIFERDAIFNKYFEIVGGSQNENKN
ncbi:hypothetical protein [Staphylococcus nepalensis]|uniref:hypothetical protein n=1 Tax=Staphylococcus nepalensis TaxID=214473 RepID=UPI003EE792AA